MRRIIQILMLLAALPVCAQTPGRSRTDAILAELRDPSSSYIAVVAHRGDWRNFKENTTDAIESAINMGVDIVELDVQLSKDSVLVLSHDRTINRCTTGRGKISRYTAEELSAFGIQTLKEALECSRDRICVNIDKGFNYYEQILSVAAETGTTGQIIVKSKRSADAVTAKLAAHAENTIYMPMASPGNDVLESFLSSEFVPLAYEVNWDTDDGSFEKTAARILRSGSKVWINTLNASHCGGSANNDIKAWKSRDAEAVYGRWLRSGVSIIQTDNPEMLISFLHANGRH